MNTNPNPAALDKGQFDTVSDRRVTRINDREHQPTVVPPAVVETDFAELKDGSLVEMIEDPEDSSNTLLAVFKDGEVRFTNRLQHGDELLVPISRDKHIIKHVRLPRGVKGYESVQSLFRKIWSIFSECLDLNEPDQGLLVAFVLSTWFIDKLPVAPYVSLVGLPQSGKSTTLAVLRLLCRRALLTADITSAAFYRACDRLTPTLLIDETDTAGERRVLFHLLRTGTTRGVTALRRDQSFNTFGAKAISWTDLPNDSALNSRCIIIPLHETHRTDLRRPASPQILEIADDLQRQLLQFRFDKYNSLSLPKIQSAGLLHSRARDLYEALALPIGDDPHFCETLAKVIKLQEACGREPLSPRQAAVLEALFRCIHKYPKVCRLELEIGKFTKIVNELSADANPPLSPRAVGAALTSFGLTGRTRTNTGCKVLIDPSHQKKIHDIHAAYGIDNDAYGPPADATKQCDLCKSLEGKPRLEPTKRDSDPEESTKCG
jgi:hypothetical protein